MATACSDAALVLHKQATGKQCVPVGLRLQLSSTQRLTLRAHTHVCRPQLCSLWYAVLKTGNNLDFGFGV